MLEVDAMRALTAQISAMENMKSTYFSNMALGQQHAQVNAVQQPPSWPQCNANGYQPQAQREQPKQQTENMSLEEMLKKIMADQAQLAADVRNNQLATQNLEKQFGQFASAQNSRPQGGLPGNTNPNPKQVNAVSTRSGLQLEKFTAKERNTEVINTESEPKEGELKENEVVAPEENVQPIVTISSSHIPGKEVATSSNRKHVRSGNVPPTPALPRDQTRRFGVKVVTKEGKAWYKKHIEATYFSDVCVD
uniref:Integrase core domain containing protein n=1 Tax=Solanum tuberosum TaxID=4113 RepID=M1DVU1_SOLTU